MEEVDMDKDELLCRISTEKAEVHSCCQLAQQALIENNDVDEAKSLLKLDADKIRAFDIELYNWLNE